MRTTLANSGERIHLAILPRVCGHRCLRSRSCACPSNQSRASARCSLDPRVRSASHIYVTVDSWRGPRSACAKGASRFGEGHKPACHLRLPRVCLHLAHPSMRRTSRPFLTHTALPARRGRRIHAVRELWQGNRPARTKMPLCWQDVANMRSPGARRWQNAREMRSRAAIRGKFCAPCIPKAASDGKIASSRQDSRAMHPK